MSYFALVLVLSIHIYPRAYSSNSCARRMAQQVSSVSHISMRYTRPSGWIIPIPWTFGTYLCMCNVLVDLLLKYITRGESTNKGKNTIHGLREGGPNIYYFEKRGRGCNWKGINLYWVVLKWWFSYPLRNFPFSPFSIAFFDPPPTSWIFTSKRSMIIMGPESKTPRRDSRPTPNNICYPGLKITIVSPSRRNRANKSIPSCKELTDLE